MASKEEVETMMEQIGILSKELASLSDQKKKSNSAYLLMPPQRKIKPFTGKSQDTTITLEDWLCDVNASIASRPLAEQDKVQFMFQHLDGPAREEVKLRPTEERDTVEKFTKILHDVFDIKATGVQLQRHFFENKQ